MLSKQAEFAKHLFQEGYPLWSPDPSLLPEDRDAVGIKIGDVGAVDEDGHFELFFNICEPRHNDSDDMLPGFIPIEKPEVVPIYGELRLRNVVSSPRTSRWTVDSLQSNTPSQRRTLYRTSLTADGAHIILPRGADHHKLTRQHQALFENLARVHGREWYRISRDQFALGSDPLYLITGFYKTCSWALVSFQINNDTGVGVRCEVVERDERKIQQNESHWHPAGRVQHKIGPLPENEGRKNQCVFISGIVITPNEQLLKQEQQAVGIRALFPFPAWLQSTSPKGIVGPTKADGDSIEVTIDRFPQVRQKSPHPGEVINRYLLKKNPTAGIAVTPDTVWMRLIEAEQLSTIDDLERRIEALVAEHYSIQLDDGTVYLKDKELVKGTAALAHFGLDHSSLPAHGLQSIIGVEEVPIRGVDDTDIGDGTLLETSDSATVVGAGYTCSLSPAGTHKVPGTIDPPLLDVTNSEQFRRPIKIIVISDYICNFCYVGNKRLHEAMEACHDLPVHFDIEFRPFTTLSPYSSNAAEGLSRKAFLTKTFGRGRAEAMWRVAVDMAEGAGLQMAEDGVICQSIQAHRVAAKAYQVGGQAMQQKLNSLIFDAYFAKGEDISHNDFLADAVVKVGLMDKQRAMEFLESTETLDSVEKMIEGARANGVNGVPLVIIDGKWAINGAQPTECYVQILRKVAQTPVVQTIAAMRESSSDHKDSIIASEVSVQ